MGREEETGILQNWARVWDSDLVLESSSGFYTAQVNKFSRPELPEFIFYGLYNFVSKYWLIWTNSEA